MRRKKVLQNNCGGGVATWDMVRRVPSTSTKGQALKVSKYSPRKPLLAYLPCSVVSERMGGECHVGP